MFKLPKKLKIGGHTFKVSEVELNSLGECDSTKNTIKIMKGIPESQKVATLIHEIFHAINTTFSHGHNFSHSLLDSLSEQFYQVLSDNKLLKDTPVKKEVKKKK